MSDTGEDEIDNELSASLLRASVAAAAESEDELRARARFAEIAGQHTQERERAQVTALQERVRGMTYEQMMARATGPMLTAVPT